VLGALLDEGYIEAIGQSRSAAAPFQQTVQQTIQQKPQQANPAPSFANTPFSNTSSANNSSNFLEARDAMTREIMQLLGKDAEMVVAKIQRCENGMDLFAMMMGLKKIIGMYASNEKADAFATKFAYVSTL
jgi:hypothetical protein